MATTYTIDLSQLKWDDADGQFSTVDAAVTVGGAQYTLAAAGTEITLVSATAPTVTLGTLTATVDDEDGKKLQSLAFEEDAGLQGAAQTFAFTGSNTDDFISASSRILLTFS